ncbi:MAG: ABC transporter substrate-binding protein [Gemmatimonadales bacterium]
MRHAAVLACVLLAASCRAQPRVSRIELTDDWGRRAHLAAPARRIVSLAPETTELVFALGLGERLVGRTTWCDWPVAARLVADVGNGIGPNVEAIAARHPDLVLVYPSEANRQAVAQLDALGIPAAALKQDAIADWRSTVRWVARATGSESAADSLLADFDRRLAAARRPAGEASPSVFVVVETSPPMAIGGGSFISELVALAGARNAFGDIRAPSAVVGLEAVAQRDPDVVLVLGSDSEATALARRPGWPAIAAVRRGRVIAIQGSEFNRPSPRLPEAVKRLAERFDAAERSRR